VKKSDEAYKAYCTKDLKKFTIEVGADFRSEMTNPRLEIDGRTKGEAAQQGLHNKLQQFIDMILDRES